MFGDGHLASCKPISEADLASFMADCVEDKQKINQVLPIGGACMFVLVTALLLRRIHMFWHPHLLCTCSHVRWVMPHTGSYKSDSMSWPGAWILNLQLSNCVVIDV